MPYKHCRKKVMIFHRQKLYQKQPPRRVLKTYEEKIYEEDLFVKYSGLKSSNLLNSTVTQVFFGVVFSSFHKSYSVLLFSQ